MIIKCPICGSDTTISKRELSDGRCKFDNYVCHCHECKMFYVTGAADNYYNREYFKGEDEFINYVLEKIKKAIKKRC